MRGRVNAADCELHRALRAAARPGYGNWLFLPLVDLRQRGFQPLTLGGVVIAAGIIMHGAGMVAVGGAPVPPARRWPWRAPRPARHIALAAAPKPAAKRGLLPWRRARRGSAKVSSKRSRAAHWRERFAHPITAAYRQRCGRNQTPMRRFVQYRITHDCRANDSMQ